MQLCVMVLQIKSVECEKMDNKTELLKEIEKYEPTRITYKDFDIYFVEKSFVIKTKIDFFKVYALGFPVSNNTVVYVGSDYSRTKVIVITDILSISDYIKRD